jgi:hypothetical protein
MPVGPLTGQYIAEAASSGCESEVDITDILGGEPLAIRQSMMVSNKGGPRIRHVIDQIIDIKHLKTTVSLSHSNPIAVAKRELLQLSLY